MTGESMNSRERVALCLNHKSADRVPIDLGGQSNTSLTRGAFEALRRYRGESDVQAPIMAKHFQTIEVPEEYLRTFGVDVRGIKPGKPKQKSEKWLEDGSYIDHWGVTYSPAMGGAYYDITANPLRDAEYGDLEAYDYYDPLDEGISEGAHEKAKTLYETTEYAIVANLTEAQIFERAWYLRGLDSFLMDLCLDKRFAHRLLRMVTDIQKQRAEQFLRKTGEYLSIVKVSDDLAGQLSPIISPDMYREMIKPYHIEYFDHMRKFTDAPIALHCCGNIRPLLPDVIDTGVRILHPFQFSCGAMEPAALKTEFGKDIVFWGGMDTQKFLPQASAAEVKKEVRKIVSIMADGGGFIFSPTHNLQADIPPENIIAMYEEAQSIRLA